MHVLSKISGSRSYHGSIHMTDTVHRYILHGQTGILGLVVYHLGYANGQPVFTSPVYMELNLIGVVRFSIAWIYSSSSISDAEVSGSKVSALGQSREEQKTSNQYPYSNHQRMENRRGR